MPFASNRQVSYGWKNIRLLFGIYMFGVGFVFYGFNVIFPEMVSVMGWRRGDAAWAQTVHGLLFGFAAPVVAVVTNRFGARTTLVTGLIVVASGCVLLATVVSEIWQWVLVWGVVMAFGFAFGGVIPIQATITQWFDRRRSMALGLVMSAAGVGGFVAQPLFTWVAENFGGWRSAWLAATGFAIAALLLTRGIVNRPGDLDQTVDGDSDDAAGVDGRGAPKTFKTRQHWTLKEALATRSLWLLIVLFLAAVLPLYILMVHGVLHLTDLRYERMEAASVLSFMLAGSAFARFPLGWLGDQIEPRLILTVLNIAAILAMVLIWRAPNVGLLLLAGVLYGAAYGGAIVLLPTLIANYYGAASFASINGFIFPVQIIFASVAPVAAGYLADQVGNYDLAFMTVIAFLAVAVFCALIATPPQKAVQNSALPAD